MTKCFIAMPILTPPAMIEQYGNDSHHFQHVLTHLLNPAVKRAGMEAISPIASGADLIQAEIIRHLETADIVLCDMSGLNANVFFELGIRTAVNRSVCLIRDRFVDSAPFDTKVLNYYEYDAALTPWNIPAEIDRIAEHLKQSHERSNGENPLWRFFGLTKRAEPAVVDSPDAKLDLILNQLQNLEPILRRQKPTIRQFDLPLQWPKADFSDTLCEINWNRPWYSDKQQPFAFVTDDGKSLGIVDQKNKVIRLWRPTENEPSKEALEKAAEKAGFTLKWIDTE